MKLLGRLYYAIITVFIIAVVVFISLLSGGFGWIWTVIGVLALIALAVVIVLWIEDRKRRQ